MLISREDRRLELGRALRRPGHSVALGGGQAGDDRNILPEHNAAFDAALTAAGVEHELVVYEGAPHSFFDRRHEEYAEQSADAWERVLAFLERHTP